jgi:hypothetical protein
VSRGELSPLLTRPCSPGANPAEYRQQFQSLNPSNGYLGGGAARDFFMKSGLPMDQLAQIWRLAGM